MGAFREAGTPVTWKNPQFVPESQRQNGGWYYNPATNRVDRWWTDGGGGSSGGGQRQSAPSAPSAEEIMRRAAEERNRKYQEQARVWNEFMNSPTFWDAVLARQMSEQYFNPYYKTILEEYVNPIQTRIRQSQENEQRVLQELTRQTEVGAAEKKDELMENIEKAQGGFAGAGVYGGGSARRALARTKIAGSRDLEDFLSGAEAKKTQLSEEEKARRELYQNDIAQKERETEREKVGAIETDVAKQKTQATKGQAARAYNQISNQFGEFMLNIPDWLQI